MDLATSESLKATCQILSTLNAISFGVSLVLAFFVLQHGNAAASLEVAFAGLSFFPDLRRRIRRPGEVDRIALRHPDHYQREEPHSAVQHPQPHFTDSDGRCQEAGTNQQDSEHALG